MVSEKASRGNPRKEGSMITVGKQAADLLRYMQDAQRYGLREEAAGQYAHLQALAHEMRVARMERSYAHTDVL